MSAALVTARAFVLCSQFTRGGGVVFGWEDGNEDLEDAFGNVHLGCE